MYLLYLVFFSCFIDFPIQKKLFSVSFVEYEKNNRKNNSIYEWKEWKISKNWIFNCTFAMCVSVIHSIFWIMIPSQRSIDCNEKNDKELLSAWQKESYQEYCNRYNRKKLAETFHQKIQIEFSYSFELLIPVETWELKSFYFVLCKISCFCTRILKRLQVHIKDAIET